jgi:dienelactone hydrolase
VSVIETAEELDNPALITGRRSITVIDHRRGDRVLPTEVWYPAIDGGEPRSVYEVLPGVAFRGVAALDAPAVAPGRYPLILMSHGRTGTRIAYSLLCEALAARGAVVIAPDHPGDALLDWLWGTNVDDRTNETQRVDDANHLFDLVLSDNEGPFGEISTIVDGDRLALVGHSYGAYTAFATAAGAPGVPGRRQVGAVVGLQPYVRSLSDELLGRMSTPFLIVVGETDTVTPAHTDADRAWDLGAASPAWRLDLLGAGHQASSDIALYAELADRVPDLPAMVRDYLIATAEGTSGEGVRPWRDVLADQVSATWAFLSVALGIDVDGGLHTARRLAASEHLVLSRR